MAINPRAVADIGVEQVRTVAQPLHAGRGYKAPMAGETTHHSGSQGKH